MASSISHTSAEPKAMNTFFHAKQYAVIGASKDRAKFGNRVLRWYQGQHLPVTPVHPALTEIEGAHAVPSLHGVIDQAAGPGAGTTSVSVITPPAVSLQVLREFSGDSRIQAFWLQPGAADGTVVQWLRSQPEDVQERIVWSGPCILKQGEQLARANGRL
ncbi:hypothetical protein MSPP1_000655 [Malassezia sp. CBS 17886]|nr:hypothetical protein MSPP1_000655 [Malassezia sp. CBS 17886]